MTFRASPPHQHTTRRGPNNRMYVYKDFYGGKAHIPTPGGILPEIRSISLISMCRPKGQGFCAFRSENEYRFCPLWQIRNGF